ncbi:hypothetical protein SAMN05216532_1305 [Streptomyces sp. 2231.1]|uniref:hypothetical protein n=1 Tax=unclassified Streptomyces TaxID=2593676 RepID=UPI000895AC0E|nr:MULTISPECIES: hypothetical protein [unclassified Streptomyces]SEC40681.1 hypothetical protein SAMN05216532_1305 [Streptomyces sp. 2231.1]
MKHPPDRIDVAVGLRRVLQDLSAVERWAEGDAGAAPPEPYADEEPWDGPEFSVETVSDSSMHTVVDITLRCGHDRSLPGPDRPGEDEVAALRSTVRALLDLAGVGSGRAWTTVVLTDRGPRVVSCRLDAGETVFAREPVPGRD